MTVTKNKIIAPVNPDETWGDHFAARSWTSFQDQVDAGYPYVAQPTAQYGSWVSDVIDYGRVIDACLITLSFLRIDKVGNIPIQPKIEWSEDGVAWEEEDASQAYATNFQYVRITLEFATIPSGTPMGMLLTITVDEGGATNSDKDFCVVSDIRVKLDVKEITDSGRDAVTGGAPEDGKVVPFNKEFIDIRAVTITAEKDGDISKTGIYSLVEDPELPAPTEMTVYLIDNATGSYVTGNFSWIVRGI